ncbi:unnamed protein product [Sympodiomycopsis kandeliae]
MYPYRPQQSGPTQDDTTATAASPPSSSSLINPVPLSIPSILIEPRSRSANRSQPSSSSLHSSSYPPNKQRASVIGKRKVIRYNNNRFTSNPHIVRPSKRDLLPFHANDKGKSVWNNSNNNTGGNVRMEDVPRDEREMRQWRLEWMAHQSQNKDQNRKQALQPGDKGLSSGDTEEVDSGDSGMYSMSLSEAKLFLRKRAGVVSRKDPSSSHAEASPLQALVDCIETEFQTWKDQVVYKPQDEVSSRVIIPNDDDESGEYQYSSSYPSSSSSPSFPSTGRVVEVSHQPHTIIYSISDSFDRLLIHSLARVWNFKSFSKNDVQDSTKRLTYILKPPERKKINTHSQNGRLNPLIQHLSKGRSTTSPITTVGVGRSRVGIGGLETPPTTDVGSEIDLESEQERWTASEDESEMESEQDHGFVSDRDIAQGAVWSDDVSDHQHADDERGLDPEEDADGGLGDVEEESEDESEDELHHLADETLKLSDG